MAFADYRLCDVCERKVFYDANLNYEFEQPKEPCLVLHGGKEKHYTLEHLGDWSVLCDDCSKTHRTVIVRIENGEVRR